MKCELCGNDGHDKDGCPHFGYTTSANLFEALGASPEEAQKHERGVNAILRRGEMKIVNDTSVQEEK